MPLRRPGLTGDATNGATTITSLHAPPDPHTSGDISTHRMLADIDQSLEHHHRLAAKVAFDRLFTGWDDDPDDTWVAGYWEARSLTEDLGLVYEPPTSAGSTAEEQLNLTNHAGPRATHGRFTRAQHQTDPLGHIPVSEPLFELTFTIDLANLDAAAYQEAHQGSPVLICMPYEDERLVLSEVLDDQDPERFELYDQQVQQYRARLGLPPRPCQTAPPEWVQDTLFPPPPRRRIRPPSCR